MGQFKMNCFNTPIRLDRKTSGGSIMLLAWEDMPVKLIDSKKLPIEGFFVEMNLRKQKLFLKSQQIYDRSSCGDFK